MSRTFGPGDRIAVRGVLGVVIEVVRRSKPAFFGYLVSLNGGEPMELPGRMVQEPHRPLLVEWRKWREDDLGNEYVALLDDARLEQLQHEYWEERRDLARKHPNLYERMKPQRVEGVRPVHRVTLTITRERCTNRSSNGAFERVFERKAYWLYCPCGFHTVRETSPAARAAKSAHEDGDPAQ